MDLVIRGADLGDLGALRALFAASALSNPGDRANLQANPDALDLPPGPVAEGRTRVATTVGGRIVGFCSTLVTDDVAEIEDLFVDPEWQGRGVGRALVRDALGGARRHRAKRVVVTSNHRARTFYERLGFVYDGEVATRFGPAARLALDLPVGPPLDGAPEAN